MLMASTRSLASSAWTSSVLPWVTRFGPSSCFRRFTSAMSRRSTEPAQLVSTLPERNHVLLDGVEQLGDAAMGSVFVLVGPVRGENLVGRAAEQEVEFLLEDAVDLFAERSIEIGHRPAAELEAVGRILGRPAGRLHDAIHGNLGADNNLPHRSLSLFDHTTNGLRPIRHVPAF